MKLLCYIEEKNSNHGYLKLVREIPLAEADAAHYHGPEIHLIVRANSAETKQKMLGNNFNSEGLPLGRAFLDEPEPREVKLVKLIEIIKCGEDEEMTALWKRLEGHALKIYADANSENAVNLDSRTLSFEVLREAGLIKVPCEIPELGWKGMKAQPDLTQQPPRPED